MMASLVTDASESLARAVAELAVLVEDGLLAGVHLEGPWLSPAHKGAHDPALLKSVKAGDKIKFDAEHENGQYVVTKIEKAK